MARWLVARFPGGEMTGYRLVSLACFFLIHLEFVFLCAICRPIPILERYCKPAAVPE